ncbi:MAG: S49 family peptidase [Parvibaculum sp.]|uniref:S49 family peptidase n=1 Tax=Parvibaculum sp. TaxID=2024848 RepID=UPI002730B6CC|nr:S49 family peptidase [Parvibaculum sp.]MDP1628850.1 S49 family peptidase [Parvibaculum sp.]MDP2148245.1 S49 family peptidase [Parvibaculum sp.]
MPNANPHAAPARSAFRPSLMHGGFAADAATARRMIATAPAREASGEMAHLSAYCNGGAREKRKPYGFRDGVAIIGVRGYLMDEYPWLGDNWATGYDSLRYQSEMAHADEEVRGVALDVRSYGGYVAGCFDLCDDMAAMRKASGKPVVAICSEYAYSAAYAVIASAAGSISVPRTGGVGSIGVICEHWNYAGALQKWGDEVTLIYSGEHKADGNPFEALPDQVKADLQAELDATRKLFAETVSRGRMAAGAKLTVEQVLATEARTYDGPARTAEAVTLGLADAVLAPAAAFAAFVAAINGNED